VRDSRSNECMRKYARLYREVLEKRSIRRARVAEEAANRLKNRLRQDIRYHYDLFHGRILTLIVPLLVVLTTIFAALHLDGRALTSIDGVFAPIYALFGTLILAALSVCWVRYRGDEYVYKDAAESEYGCMPFSSNVVIRTNKRLRVLSLLLPVSLLLFTVFLNLRLADSIQWHYGLVFMPIWVIFALLIDLLRPRLLEADQRRALVSFWMFLLSPLLVFSVLVCLRLQGTYMPLQYVFIPFWVVESIFTFLPFLASLAAFAHHLHWIRWNDTDARHAVYACMFSVVLFLPLIVFQILLALQDEGASRSYATVFVPLLLWESMFMLAAITVSLLIHW